MTLSKRNGPNFGNARGTLNNSGDGIYKRLISTPSLPYPFSLGNIELYLRADTGVTLNGSTVSAWADQSGYGRNFSQGTSTKQPTYSSSDANFSNKPSISFDGSNDVLNTSANFSPNSTGTGISVAIVYRSTDSGTGQILSMDYQVASTAGNVCSYEGYANTDQYTITHYGNSSGGNATVKNISATRSNVQRVISTFDASAGSTAPQYIYVNGTAGGSYSLQAAGNRGSWASSPWAVGARPVGNDFWVGKITCAMVFSRILTADEIATLDSWLQTNFT